MPMLALIATLALASDPQCTHSMTGDFSHVVLLGQFANDAGCMSEGYTVDGKHIESTSQSAPALASAGWAKKEKRVKLAATWAEETAGGAFASEHQDTLNKDGSVTIVGWIRYPAGMKPERVKVKVKMVFAADGSLTINTLDRVVEPM